MITMKEYERRRMLLMQKMGEASLAILPAAKAYIRNGDTTFPFRQNSYFYYLTGFSEANAILVLAPHREAGKYLLFAQQHTQEEARWIGKSIDAVQAHDDFGVDSFYAIDAFKEELSVLLRHIHHIYYPMECSIEADAWLLDEIRQTCFCSRHSRQISMTLIDIKPILDEMRLIKSDAEIALMQQAVDVSAHGYAMAMQQSLYQLSESVLDAILRYTFYCQGAREVAYPIVVGSGENSCILHYTQNDKIMREGDLVLIDAGAEYQNYAADITRTIPVNGCFSQEQRLIYELVLKAQLAAIQVIRPGVSWYAPQEIIINIFVEGLITLGILSGDPKTLIKNKAYLPFYMHQSGHWIGLDVHDVGSYKIDDDWRIFQPNMVLTVEPGLYLSCDIPGLEKKWHYIGIRIEDTVQVTTDGVRVLSDAIPKQIDEIERLMATKRLSLHE